MVLQETAAGSELVRLRDFFTANAKSARAAAEKADNLAGHARHTGEAYAFESAAGYCDLALKQTGY